MKPRTAQVSQIWPPDQLFRSLVPSLDDNVERRVDVLLRGSGSTQATVYDDDVQSTPSRLLVLAVLLSYCFCYASLCTAFTTATAFDGVAKSSCV